MKCKWYFERDYACANSKCPYGGDTCPTSEHPEVCKHSENKYEVSELVRILRCCSNIGYVCEECPANLDGEDCDGRLAKLQAADMLEKLAAENDAKKPEWISVKDRLPEKKHEACLCCLDSCLFPGSQYIDIRVFYDDGKWANGMVTHWMPLPELPKEDER